MSVANHVAHHAELGEEPRISTKSAANQIEEVSDQVSEQKQTNMKKKTSCCLLPFSGAVFVQKPCPNLFVNTFS